MGKLSEVRKHLTLVKNRMQRDGCSYYPVSSTAQMERTPEGISLYVIFKSFSGPIQRPVFVEALYTSSRCSVQIGPLLKDEVVRERIISEFTNKKMKSLIIDRRKRAGKFDLEDADEQTENN